MVEGGMKCVKYLLFAFNFLFFLIGLILIVTGALIQSSFREYFEVIGGEFNAVAALLIAVGIIIFIIGFFGCCGAWRQNYCMITTFAGLLVLIFILELAAGIAGFALRSRVEGVVRAGLNQSLDQYDNSTATRQAWDQIQEGLKCCGVTDYRDWEGKLAPGQVYPKSCCMDQTRAGCGVAPGQAYQDGCLNNMEAYITTNLLWVGVIGLVVALVQVIGVVFACCLGKAVKAEYDVV